MKKSAKSVRVALVLPTEYAYARAVLRGIIAATRERNMYVDRSQHDHPGSQLPWLFNVFRGIYGHSTKYLSRWFREWNPDGIIGQIYGDRLADVYVRTKKPVVELFESRRHSQFPRILNDDVAIGQWAARHFTERGFRHFAFFGAAWMLWSRERESGFKAEIARFFQERSVDAGNGQKENNGTEARNGHARDAGAAPFTFASFGDLPPTAAARKKMGVDMGAWLASLPKPLALFAANDLWGSELIQAARERGLNLQGNLAVLGVDNDELLCEMTHPPLSSIRLGAEQVGRAAVALLERLLRGEKIEPEEQPRIGPMELVTRQSTDVLAVEDEEVASAIRHIRRHAVEGMSVKQLLSEVTVNRRTLERRFASVLGHSPLEEIRRVRLERAKVLLQTDLPIYDVAKRSGYATPEYLATSFRQATGVAPTAYRRQFGPRSHWDRLPPSLLD
jgi:LacI family transcriptional regulator